MTRPLHMFALLTTLMTLSLTTQGCWDAPTVCASDVDCFVGESCQQGLCKLGQDSRADMSMTPDLGRPDQPEDLCANIQCEAEQVCDRATGQCTAGCAQGEHLCAGVCVSDDAVTSCGQRCEPCPGAQDGAAACQEGQCTISCEANQLECQGRCAQCPVTDRARGFMCQADQCVISACEQGSLLCQGTCSPCPAQDGASFGCEADRCVVSACPQDTKSCDGVCVQCPQDPNGQGICQGSSCVLQCDEGSLLCNDKCSACPSGDRVLSFGCGANDACVATDCAQGYMPCAQGCCALMPPTSGPILTTDAKHLGIATTRDSLPVVVYDDTANNNPRVRVARFDGQGQWVREDISPGVAAGPESIFIDSAGAAHIAYLSQDLKTVRYARKTNNLWVSEDILQVADEGEPTSLSLRADSQGGLHIAVANDTDINYATRQPQGWRRTTVYNGDGGKRGVSLAFFQDQPRITFRSNFNTPNIRYARLVNGQWDNQRISANNAPVRAEHLSMLIINTPVIFTDDELSGGLKLYTLSSNAWQRIDISGRITNQDALELEGLGNATFTPVKNLYQLVYHHSISGQATLLNISNNAIQSVDLGAISQGTRPAIASDTTGGTHIVFSKPRPQGNQRELYYEYQP